MKRYDETPWWCKLLWPWFGPPWYAQITDPDACLDAIRRVRPAMALTVARPSPCARRRRGKPRCPKVIGPAAMPRPGAGRPA
jgi:hypothetical protein